MKKPAILGLVLLLLVWPAAAAAAPFSNVFAFGDSLTDNGNLRGTPFEPLPPYFDARFSNGPVWVEYLAMGLGLDPAGIRDFAVGGAKAAGARLQVMAFVGSGPAPSDGLYVLWAGGNDLRSISTPAEAPGVILGALLNIGLSVALLAGAGAETILVPNLPPLGLVPEVLGTGDLSLIILANLISVLFNQGLANMLGSLEGTLGIDIVPLDIFSLFLDVRADPGAFGLSDVTTPCLDDLTLAVCATPGTFLFWDDIHPTTAGHRLLAGAALGALGIPLPSSLLLLAAGAVSLGLWRRRRGVRS